MAGSVCTRCGQASLSRFCSECGAERSAPAPIVDDPWLGAVLADRYTVVELLGVGGMARVYRGRQRMLDREVAIKVLHPELLVSPDSVPRFVAEARLASRLNHPNVVSIFDFGLASSGGKQFYLVMELLTGVDLGTLLGRAPHLPLPRVASILCQVLAALQEAHEAGITHRDIKPENIFVEPARDGTDRVKVIDFGIAKATSSTAGPTQRGQAVGTPSYMAPEQLMGGSGPSVDLYAVGVCLFQMLTGRLPFDSPSLTALLQMHATGERPDPKLVAPQRVTRAIADVSLRALSADPARRYPSAGAFAEAIARAFAISNPASSRRPASLLSLEPSLAAGKAEVPSTLPVLDIPPSSRVGLGDGPFPDPDAMTPLVGRSEDLTWAESLIGTPRRARGIVYYGRTGTGRSRIAREVGEQLARQGTRVVHVPGEGPPAWEVGYGWLRRAITVLAGPALDAARAAPERLVGHEVADGLAATFARDIPPGMDANTARRATRAALAWAIGCAVDAELAREAGDPSRVAVCLVIDDVDLLDSASQLVLSDFLLIEANDRMRYRFVMTSELCPDTAMLEGLQARALEPLLEADATRLLPADTRVPSDAILQPLYLSQLRRWYAEGKGDEAPPTLEELCAGRLADTTASERRVLQALAIVGAAGIALLRDVLARPEDIDEALLSLVARGFVVVHRGMVAFTHSIFGRIAVHAASTGAICDLRVRVADAMALEPGSQEARAHHAICGRPDFEAFFLVEQAAQLRTRRGDDEGAIAALYDGVRGARAQLMTDEGDAATSALLVFSRKLGEALIAIGRADEAYGVLSEAADHADVGTNRALLLHQLARACELRDRPKEAQELRTEAAGIASQSGDALLAARLRTHDSVAITGVRRRSSFQRRSSAAFTVPPVAASSRSAR
jgi:serine/threonine-protein kinase